MAKSADPPKARTRCAIYTRKSSEEGLDQDFNSLHAQREACEAYVKSQAGEGWQLLPELYDDGGYSGGNIERPALKKLLSDIDRGAVDIVVVYKIDRLTRSLMDFAKIVDHLDAKSASFVSVTQSFNTTTSMGRLTLNVLLSFAQFEREVTGERIRDKLAASKKKGMWMGGSVPLGYDVEGRTLRVNEAEAEQVRHIFRRYLEIGSVHVLQTELDLEGYRSKQRTSRRGRTSGGEPMQRGAIFYLLANRIYVGEIAHKGAVYQGQHPAVLDRALFDDVQALLAAHRPKQRQPDGRRHVWPLTGKLFDATGHRMTPTKSYGRSGKVHRYYVAVDLQAGRRRSHHPMDRLPASQVEVFLRDQLDRLLVRRSPGDPFTAIERAQAFDASVVLNLVDALSTRQLLADVESRLLPGEKAWIEGGHLQIVLPVCLKMRGGRSWRSGPASLLPAKPKLNKVLIDGLKRGHFMMKTLSASPLQPPEGILAAQPVTGDYDRRLMKLPFLAPDIQRAILEGRQPAGLTLQALFVADIPKSWTAQRDLLNFGASRGMNGGASCQARLLPASDAHQLPRL